MTTLYCIDPRHGAPCPEPCAACPIECGTATYGVTEAEARVAFPDWQPTDPAPIIAIVRMLFPGYMGVLTRVLSTDPLRTETIAECPHRHPSSREARECAETLRP